MTIGIIGGGQLGMMIAEAASKQGVSCIALDPNPDCSCKYVCKEIICGEYNDISKLEELGKKCDVITYEFENILASPLEFLVKNYNLPQGIRQLFDSQNRIREKDNARKFGLLTPPYRKVTSKEELISALDEIGYPAIYKTTTLGYDGHGQYKINCLADVNNVVLAAEGILEGYVKFDYEASIIMIRNKEKIVSLPIAINKHKNGILDLSIVGIEKPIFNEIKKASYQFMIEANYYGILTIEYFVKDDKFYFNEMAPRPHNSGHYSIEGATFSQYDLLVNYLVGKKLEEPKLISPTIMKNILGFDYDVFKNLKPSENVYLHDYHKKEVREKRKMAHITFTNLTLDEYQSKYKNMFKGEEE